MAVECAFTYLVRLFKYLERVLWLYQNTLTYLKDVDAVNQKSFETTPDKLQQNSTKGIS